jgi:hypothetical protein
MELITCAIAIGVLIAVSGPFWLGSGGRLAAASAEQSVGQLEGARKEILTQYLKDEKAAEQGHLTAREWRGRKEFLTGRYLDASRRLDFLASTSSDEGVGES